MREHDLIIIGAGPAGISAAIAAQKRGIENITIVDRLSSPGGMLTQCFHYGFGEAIYNEELNGPGFIERLLETVDKNKIEILTNSFVSNIEEDFTVNIINENGVHRIKPKAIIVATGCRERPAGTLDIYGSRPAGVYTAGSVQKMINLFGYRSGKRAVILGSGDVGLIVAEHLTKTGTEVVEIIEKLDNISGLEKNRTRYILPNNIPIRTKCTITKLHGEKRLVSVTVCEIDEKGIPIEESAYEIECDTLITSVGLIPELEIIKGFGLKFTDFPNLFVCGNANEIHSMVDSVVEEGSITGELAAEYIKNRFS